MSAISPISKSTSNLRAAGGAAGLPAAVFRAGAFDGRRRHAADRTCGKRWFDRMVLSAPMIDLPGRATSFPTRALLRIMRLTGQGGRYWPAAATR